MLWRYIVLGSILAWLAFQYFGERNPAQEETRYHEPRSTAEIPSSDAAAATSGHNGDDGSGAMYGFAKIAVAQLRSALRDPDSLVLEDVYYPASKKAVCLKYRAKNGFGGYNREFAVSTTLGQITQSAKIFNELCAGRGPFRQVPTF